VGPPSPVPVIEVTGPGAIRVSKGTVPVAWIGPSGLETLLDGLDSHRIATMASKAFVQTLLEKLMKPATPLNTLDSARSYILFRLGNVLARTLRSILNAKHGGLLVLLPNTELPACANATYASSRHKLGGHLGASVHGFLISDLCVRLPKWVQFAPPDTAGAAAARLSMVAFSHAAAQRLAGTARLAEDIGALAGVDGAIVLSSELNVLGFGVMVNAPETKDETWRRGRLEKGEVIPEGEPIPIAAHGTRHRAALRLCREVPGAWSFVVSQDGVAKAVTSVGNDVVFFDHFERVL
jgi:hypothetical protein